MLDVSEAASAADLRAAFKRRALVAHPDKGGSKEAFQLIMHAFEVLADTSQRTKYDRRLAKVRAKAAGVAREADQEYAREEVLGHRVVERQKPRRQHPAPQQPSPAGAYGDGPPQNSHRRHAQQRAGPQGPQQPQAPQDKQHKEDGRAFRDRAQAAHEHCSDAQRRPHDQEHRIFTRIFQLLRKLPPDQRRRTLQQQFLQQQRLGLEAWMQQNVMRPPPAGARHDAGEVQLQRPARSEGSSSGASGCAEDSSGDSRAALQQLADGDAEDGDAEDSDAGGSEGETCVNDTEPAAADDGDDADEDMAVDAEDGVHGEGEPGQKSFREARGLIARRDGNNVCHEVRKNVSILGLRSRLVQDLSRAFDFYLVLTDLQQHCRCVLEAGEALEPASFRAELAVALETHGVKEEELGLSLTIKLTNKYWLGTRQFRSPQTSCIERCLPAMQRLMSLQAATRIHHTKWFFQHSPQALREYWCRIKACFLEICEQDGHSDPASLESRLEEVEEQRQPHRTRMLERWNRMAMAKEDGSFRQRTALRSERKAMAKEDAMLRDKRWERWNRRAMAKEDALGRVVLVSLARTQRISRLLQELKWQQVRQQRQKEIQQRRQQKEAALAARQLKRAARAASNERWKRFKHDASRKTMEEIMGRWGPARK